MPGLWGSASVAGEEEAFAAPAAAPGASWSQSTEASYLEPLVGQWQSQMLGYIDVRWCSQKRSALEIGRAIPDCPQPLRWGQGVVGTIEMSSAGWATRRQRASVILSLDWAAGAGQLPASLTLLTPRCRRRRVFWEAARKDARENGHGVAADIWDRWLLEAARKAAKWVSALEIDLCPEVDVALERLALDDPWVEGNDKGPTVALCISTKNRLWQLRRALPLNILHSWPFRGWAKIHVVDFGSVDNTLQFILTRCRAAIDAGLLRVYSTDQLPWWHASVAKNTSHMVAKEDILVNLDGDNLIGPRFLQDIRQRFGEGCTCLQYEDGDGTCGRIACWRSDFLRIRGYDEDCFPMGAQDTDLAKRLQCLPKAVFKRVKNNETFSAPADVEVTSWGPSGLEAATSVTPPRSGRNVLSQAIPNTLQAKTAMCDPTLGLRWGQMDTFNRDVFNFRRSKGQIARNLGQENIGVHAWLVDPSA